MTGSVVWGRDYTGEMGSATRARNENTDYRGLPHCARTRLFRRVCGAQKEHASQSQFPETLARLPLSSLRRGLICFPSRC